MNRAYLGLGSNLEDPLKQLQSAVNALGQLPNHQITRISSVYQSSPLGPQDQPDYLNAVLLLRTDMEALELLDAMQAIEIKQGRVRSEHWGPRTIDLDILLFGDSQIDTERLTVPHPRLHERDFVLYPLAEICDGNLLLPNGTDLDTLRLACPGNKLEKTRCRLQLS